MTERRSLSLPPPLFAVVPAAGVGARMGAGLPKQYLTLQGRTLAEHTLGRLLAFAPLQAVVMPQQLVFLKVQEIIQCLVFHLVGTLFLQVAEF